MGELINEHLTFNAEPITMEMSFDTYNNEIFDGYLPTPRFKAIHSTTYFGKFKTYRIGDYGKSVTICMRDMYIYSQEQFANIIVHEMIHYYLSMNGINSSSHGKEFMQMAEWVNINFGLNVTARINTKEYTKKQLTFCKRLIYLFS